MKRVKIIDVESAEGVAEFKRMAGKGSAHSQARGLGDRADSFLLKALADKLRVGRFDEQTSSYETHDERAESTLRHYSSKRGHALAWRYDGSGVPSVLERLAIKGDEYAQELLNRVRGKRGLFDPAAEADYYGLHAQERARDASDYAQLGNPDAQRLANEVAKLSRRLADVLRGEGELRPRKQAKADDPRWVRARKKLEQYEVATVGMERLSPGERAVAARLAAKHRQTLHNYDRDVTRAVASRTRRAGAPAKDTANQ